MGLLIGSGRFSMLFAQFPDKLGFKSGIVSAIQDFRTERNVENLDIQPRIGWVLSLYAEWHAAQRDRLVIELQLIQKGMIEHAIRGGEEELISNLVYYLSLPIFVGTTRDVGFLHFYWLVGPRVDILIKYQTPYQSFYREFSRAGLGGELAAGLEIELPHTRYITLELRKGYDFTSAYRAGSYSVKNEYHGLVMGLGIEF